MRDIALGKGSSCTIKERKRYVIIFAYDLKQKSDCYVGKDERWPDFFIVGAAKAGTTSLYTYLNDVPEVCMSTIKEPHFFSPNVLPESLFHAINTKEEYLKMFKVSPRHRTLGEASPTYLWDKDSAKAIHSKVPDAKIIMMLRDPILRAYSHYLHHVRIGWDKRSFDQAINDDFQSDSVNVWKVPNLYVTQGFYADQARRYFDLFDPANIKIIIFEEFVKDTRNHVAGVMRFLGLESAIPPIVGEVINPFLVSRNEFSAKLLDRLIKFSHAGKTRYKLTHIIPEGLIVKILSELLLKKSDQKPSISSGAREFLSELYRPQVKELETLLGRPLPWKISEVH
jgi:Sulfotransferase family